MLMLDKFPNGDLGNQKRIIVREGQRQRNVGGAAVVATSHLSASFPENTEGLGMRASGRTWTYTGTSAGFCRVTTSSCRKILNLRDALKCMRLQTGSNKNRIVCTHRGAICVGQREQNMLGGVDHGRPGQLCCYSSLHIFLKVCVDFKDSFNPLARIGNTLWHCVNNLHGTLGATNKRWSLKAKCRHAYLCPLCSFSSFHRRRSFWWRSTSESQISSCKTSPWGLDSAVGEKYLLLKNLFMRCRCYTHSARKKKPSYI